MIRDTFPYTARWDSVGLNCSGCTHFAGPPTWPDVNRRSRCLLHDLPLAVEIGKDGYKVGEWFCREFLDAGCGRTSRDALDHLDRMRSQLLPDVLYGFYGANGMLKEYPFSTLRH